MTIPPVTANRYFPVAAPHPLKLTRAEEFRSVLSARGRLSTKNFFLMSQPFSGSAARLGLISSRKASPRAVDRNRSKRLTRSVFHDMRDKLPCVDLVILQKTSLRKETNESIREELYGLLNQFMIRFRSNKKP